MGEEDGRKEADMFYFWNGRCCMSMVAILWTSGIHIEDVHERYE